MTRKPFHKHEESDVEVTFIDGEVKTYRITAGVSVGGYLAREAGESGILSLWNAQESTAIPISASGRSSRCSPWHRKRHRHDL